MQTTNSAFLKWWFLSSIWQKALWEKEKMLVTSIFSFSHNVFKRLLSWCGLKSGLYCQELSELEWFSDRQKLNKKAKRFRPRSACADCAGWHESILFADVLGPHFTEHCRMIVHITLYKMVHFAIYWISRSDLYACLHHTRGCSATSIFYTKQQICRRWVGFTCNILIVFVAEKFENNERKCEKCISPPISPCPPFFSESFLP